jgi:hypothetical protein
VSYIYGQHLYGEYRYSWLFEWVPQACEKPSWGKVPCTVSPWVTVQQPGAAWQGVTCDG